MTDDTDTTDDSTADDQPPEPETVTHTVEVDVDPAQVALYDHMRHRNGDETAILFCSFAGGYQALAFDVDAGGNILAVEEIGDAQDDASAASQVEYWLIQNPEGLLGGEPENDGIMAKLSGMFGGETA